MQSVNILDSYIRTAPSSQSMIDLFKGEWSSAMPSGSGLQTQPGFAGLFEDARIDWAASVLNGFQGENILELGPLEGGHSYMLQMKGADRVTSIESNSRAFLKCLIIKEIFKLNKVEVLLGDFVEYLRNDPPEYDSLIMSGVLYHMTNPVELLRLASRVSKKLFIWTHYFDPDILKGKEQFKGETIDIDGRRFSGSKRHYADALDWPGFCGGSSEYAIWLGRDEIPGLLHQLGYNRLEIGFDHADHPNGPAFAICAVKG
jgi:hypothetical protein